jgi:hypothetical protein
MKKYRHIAKLFLRVDSKIEPWVYDTLSKYVEWRDNTKFPTIRETNIWYGFRTTLNHLFRQRHKRHPITSSTTREIGL